ncbi:TetR/AcrR family transcriptional regulator [Streptomyces mangrovisoli]|uniref:TetR family transcriptional regulator n=1 Tax=Streptomyces mangrovisoli TaxID=1428628 RepID=A0A1J4NZI7_9ACTN|nr:TetR/AcrR family transcriptional regulator [Streptomyces mangrovisoli]OIJ67771.1 TetR family transcriptional regulator [Streptomyces mangrovisoli]
MSTRAALIEAAAALLAQSPAGDVSTRAVCEAAGVQQPVLYRLFGDKDGLLAATVDHVWDQYLGMKRAAAKSEDPLRDIRAGWDSHTAFALAHPHAYTLMVSPGLRAVPEAAAEAMRILREDLDRLAAQGRLRVAPETAARMIMSANTGVSLSLITRPGLYPDTSLSTLVRDAIHAAILAGPATPADPAGDARAAAVTTLLASVGDLTPEPFTAAESALFGEWLTRIPAADPAERPSPAEDLKDRTTS